MDEVTILYTTWPDAETAEAFGRLAVESRLAACANVLGPMRSIYRWDGAIHCDSETPMLLKTTPAVLESLRDLILKHHPYATPCVLALPTDPLGCNPRYSDWLRSEIT
jgi:periplasmic divalent cation tolerance protein